MPPGSADIGGLDEAIAGSGPALLLCPPGPEAERITSAVLPLARDGVPDRTAVVVATSGSTGPPKGVLLSSAALQASAHATHDYLGGPGQWLIAMSSARVAGLQAVLRSRLAGYAPVPVNTTDGFTVAAMAAALAGLEPAARHYTSMVPAQLIRLLDAGLDLSGLDAILLGGGPIPIGLPDRARAAGARVVPTYGMTETCGGCVYDGRPLPGVGIRLTDADRIAVTGPVLADGYLGGTSFGGEFVTSDLGRLTDGVLQVLGRADDVIVTGGLNVPAQAVEQVLAGHPAVADAVVVGRPDPTYGAVLVAAIVPTGTGSGLAAGATPEELRAWVTERLGRGHAPREWRTLAELPLLPSGKVDRAAVRALVARVR